MEDLNVLTREILIEKDPSINSFYVFVCFPTVGDYMIVNHWYTDFLFKNFKEIKNSIKK